MVHLARGGAPPDDRATGRACGDTRASRSRSSRSARSLRISASPDPSKLWWCTPGAHHARGRRLGPTRPDPSAAATSILFVGSIFNRRHVPELIEGFARLARSRTRTSRLEIVGDNRTSPRVDLAARFTADRARRSHSAPLVRHRRGAARALCERVGVRVPVRLRRLRPHAARGARGRAPGAAARHARRARNLRRRALYVAVPIPDLIEARARRRSSSIRRSDGGCMDAGRACSPGIRGPTCAASEVLATFCSGERA